MATRVRKKMIQGFQLLHVLSTPQVLATVTSKSPNQQPPVLLQETHEIFVSLFPFKTLIRAFLFSSCLGFVCFFFKHWTITAKINTQILSISPAQSGRRKRWVTIMKILDTNFVGILNITNSTFKTCGSRNYLLFPNKLERKA